MHLIYKQDYYEDKQKEIYDLFIDYLVPIMHNLDHPEFVEEQKETFDADAYENNLKQDEKISSNEKTLS